MIIPLTPAILKFCARFNNDQKILKESKMNISEILEWLSLEVPEVVEDYKKVLGNLESEITAEVFFKVHKEPTVRYYNTSLFGWLSATFLGRAILSILFKQYPEFYDQMTLEALYTLFPAITRNVQKTNPFYWLASYCDGQRILHEALTKNNLLITQAPLGSLTSLRPPNAGSWANTCAVTCLTSSEINMITANIAAYKIIIHNHEISQVGISAAECHDATKINFKGLAILQLFQEHHPQWLELFNDKILLCPYPLKSHITVLNANHPFLYFLILDEKCAPFVHALFTEKPTLIEQIDETFFNAPLVLYWLCLNEAGLGLLNLFYNAFSLPQRKIFIQKLKERIELNLLYDVADENTPFLSSKEIESLYDFLKHHNSPQAKMLITLLDREPPMSQLPSSLSLLSPNKPPSTSKRDHSPEKKHDEDEQLSPRKMRRL